MLSDGVSGSEASTTTLALAAWRPCWPQRSGVDSVRSDDCSDPFPGVCLDGVTKTAS